jgi:mannose-6-phosphate isomerase-like protein (cupin superfamily)
MMKTGLSEDALITQDKVVKKVVSPHCTVFEYPVPSSLMSVATAIINGRYPEQGKSKNTECEQYYYVISGHGVIHSDKGTFPISSKDCYFFQKNEAYYVEGKDLFVVLGNTPPWTLDQYVHISQ